MLSLGTWPRRATTLQRSLRDPGFAAGSCVLRCRQCAALSLRDAFFGDGDRDDRDPSDHRDARASSSEISDDCDHADPGRSSSAARSSSASWAFRAASASASSRLYASTLDRQCLT